MCAKILLIKRKDERGLGSYLAFTHSGWPHQGEISLYIIESIFIHQFACCLLTASLPWLNDSSSLTSRSLVSISPPPQWACAHLKQHDKLKLESLGPEGVAGGAAMTLLTGLSHHGRIRRHWKSVPVCLTSCGNHVFGKLLGLQTSRTFSPLAGPHYPQPVGHSPGTAGWFSLKGSPLKRCEHMFQAKQDCSARMLNKKKREFLPSGCVSLAYLRAGFWMCTCVCH